MTITLDITALGDLVVERLATDSQGAQFRTVLLGLNPTSNIDKQVIHAADLDRFRPLRPFVAFREGPIVAFDQVEVLPTLRWWIYDDTEQGYRRINTLIPLIGRAYAAKPRIQFAANGIIGNVEANSASGSSFDSSLNLNYRYVSISILAG